MKRRDKLDRYRTETMAVLTLRADVPFWVTLTPSERKKLPRRHYIGFGAERRAFRNFIRQLCEGKKT